MYLDAFEIDRYEVTNIQYSRFLAATGRDVPFHWRGGAFPRGQADYPVVGISWEDANAYCVWAGKRLPTEAEWEKACRGADGRQYPWGDDWNPQYANVGMTNRASPSTGQPGSPTAWAHAPGLILVTPAADGLGLRPVGSYPEGASPYGVLDLVGNASEWVFDWYNWGDYSEPAHTQPGEPGTSLEPLRARQPLARPRRYAGGDSGLEPLFRPQFRPCHLRPPQRVPLCAFG
ncbi:MAG: SUMF1/EgtB/PvdO family nonheme iron enzyme [Chloroflexi bacterium]|nr:SUMF1/EgtB/PvdO family nonheme iron enzyme [Chloroflexota bacterium]